MLLDRIARDDPQPPAGVAHLANHAFSAALWFLLKGDLTKAQCIAMMELTAEDIPQLEKMITFSDTFNATQKTEWHARVESAGVLLEGNYITRTQYKTLLGL